MERPTLLLSQSPRPNDAYIQALDPSRQTSKPGLPTSLSGGVYIQHVGNPYIVYILTLTSDDAASSGPAPPLHPNPPNLGECSPERRMSHGLSPPVQHQANITHYPRPINLVPPPQFLSNLHDLEQKWQISRGRTCAGSGPRYSSVSNSRRPRCHLVSISRLESGFSTGNVKADSLLVVQVLNYGPKVPEGWLGCHPLVQESWESRESPKARERSSNQSQTPERTKSPLYQTPLGSPGEHYGGKYHHDPAPVVRRPVPATHDFGRSPNLLLSTQTPPLRPISARTPEKSLPLQEEPEEVVAMPRHEHLSPTPSLPQDGRNTRAALRPEDEETLYEKSDKQDSSNDGSGTPRSPSAGLPADNAQNRFRPPQQPQP
ncbi:hypothetical protein BT96DRAFT_1009036 [Gymnopus androsaceus JB14]|uniref:Uncharacterized protein n=1 Tax=Gymnopus androsaceus JB14 TaxID=1447944 RepID=A0A6A4GDQ0_9AGAR|nr:hypothetical protein BT96DRAFT_1009036 [Gymnopus androsaceus JB14]